MNKEKYVALTKKHKPKENTLKNALVAFISGGFMGFLGQLLVDIYTYFFDVPKTMASTFMIITLIFLGCLFTCLGFFDDLVHKLKCGLIIPITGFAHAMMSATLEYRKEGLVTGIGANMFKLAGSVIVFGVVSAYTFGLIRFIIYGG